jgi:geranylgeranyl pyrophosphate synthase
MAKESKSTDAQSSYAEIVNELFDVGSELLWDTKESASFNLWLGQPFTYTVKSIPRQWPGSFIYLLTGCDKRARQDALALASIWNLFYIHDDIEDNKTTRYGQKTALEIFGREDCRRTWEKAISTIPKGKNALSNKDREEYWLKTLNNIEQLQKKRHLSGILDLDTYSEQSTERLLFIRKWWQRAAIASGDKVLANFISKHARLCSLSAQIRNDIKNTTQREGKQGGAIFSDFSDARSTFVTILTLERASLDEQNWIRDNIWGSKKPLSKDEIAGILSICQKYHVLDNLIGQLIKNIEIIEKAVDTSKLSKAQKAIWKAHIYRTYKTHVMQDDKNTLEIEKINLCEAISTIPINKYLLKHIN